MRPTTLCPATIGFGLLMLGAGIAHAQFPTPGVQVPTGPGLIRMHNLAAAPLVVSGPALGYGGGVAVSRLFQKDTTVPASTLGVGGLYASSGSWFATVGGTAHLSRDAWRINGGIGAFGLNYDFFGIGTAAGDADRSVRLSQPGAIGIADVQFQVLNDLYIGPRYRYVNLTTSVEHDDVAPLANFVRNQDRYIGSLLGAIAQYDTRDNETGPTRGFYLQGSALFARSALGSNHTFDRYLASGNAYIPLPFNQVLATRIVGCGAAGDAPPWELCLYGEGPDLRGYQTGQYRDKSMLAGQIEWRIPVWGRVGVVGFYGLGEVAPSISLMNSSNLLPSAGLGGRYLISASHHANVGFDYAWANSGGALYLRLGEAF